MYGTQICNEHLKVSLSEILFHPWLQVRGFDKQNALLQGLRLKPLNNGQCLAEPFGPRSFRCLVLTPSFVKGLFVYVTEGLTSIVKC